MSSDTSFLEEMSPADSTVLKNIAEMGKTLKQLALEAEIAEQAAKDAQQKYYQYRTQTMPMAMFEAGLRDITLTDGSRIVVNTKVYCSPNKNEADRNIMAQWLIEHGGQNLIKEQCIVDGKFKEQLGDIAHKDVLDMNTNSLKAWLKDQLGYNGGTPQFSYEDIPDCIHFVQLDEVSIEV